MLCYYKCLQGTAPEYLSNRLSKISDVSSRTTRFSDITLRCPRYIRETEGGKTFLSTARKLWNALPVPLRKSSSLKVFRKEHFKHLKTQYVGLDYFSIS